MKKMIACAIAVGAMASVLAALPAQAAPTTWTLSDVTFSDGTSATGSFTIDWAAKTWTAFDITTQDGRLPAFEYTPANSGLYFNGFGPNSFSIDRQDGRRYFTFSFVQPLDAPATVPINTTYSWDCDNCGNYRTVTAGSVTAQALSANVPEPATLALMLPALAMIRVARRRKQK